MPFDHYQGDPRLSIEENGATLTFKGGQPVMDQGLENVPLIDLFTKKGWWGNELFENPDERIGSDFEEVAREPATLTAILDTETTAKAALQHMIDTGLAKSVLVRARNPEGGRVEVAILIEPPGKDLLALLATKHGVNWIAQKEYPASERL